MNKQGRHMSPWLLLFTLGIILFGKCTFVSYLSIFWSANCKRFCFLAACFKKPTVSNKQDSQGPWPSSTQSLKNKTQLCKLHGPGRTEKPKSTTETKQKQIKTWTTGCSTTQSYDTQHVRGGGHERHNTAACVALPGGLRGAHSGGMEGKWCCERCWDATGREMLQWKRRNKVVAEKERERER